MFRCDVTQTDQVLCTQSRLTEEAAFAHERPGDGARYMRLHIDKLGSCFWISPKGPTPRFRGRRRAKRGGNRTATLFGAPLEPLVGHLLAKAPRLLQCTVEPWCRELASQELASIQLWGHRIS